MEGVYVDMENTKQTFLPWNSNEPNNKEIFNPANCLVVVSTGGIFGARCNVKFSTFCANNNGNEIKFKVEIWFIVLYTSILFSCILFYCMSLC